MPTQTARILQQLAERSRREVAQRNSSSIILTPDDIAGDYNQAQRGLLTRLNGRAAPITKSDLERFKRSAEELRKTHKGKGGITAKAAINAADATKSVWTHTSRIDRANTQIKTAYPIRYQANGVVVFRVNSGTMTGSHIVTVRFNGFPGALVESRKVDVVMTRKITGGYLRFDCDCDDHRYMYRYIATVGGWNEGRNETGFPKLRNPRLRGTCCKHVIRIMNYIQTPSFNKLVEKWVTDNRAVVRQTIDIDAKAHKQGELDIRSEVVQKSFASRARDVLSAALVKAGRAAGSKSQLSQIDAALRSGALPKAVYNKVLSFISKLAKGK